MPEDRPGRVTRLLEEISAGKTQAIDELMPLVYDELRRLARSRVARERATAAPQATSLVHQAYIRLVGDKEIKWENRGHFFAAAAEAMRRILIEQARGRSAGKRGGGDRAGILNNDIAAASPQLDEVLAVDQALARLEKRDPEMAQVVKLRYFAGLSIPETASALKRSERTVNRVWTAARAWLQREITP